MKWHWLLLLLPTAAMAQARLTLADAITRALESHPLLPAAARRVEASEGLRRQAGLAPNPALVFQTEGVRPYGNPPFRFWNETDNLAYLQQTFETAGKRERRLDVAAGEVERSRLEVELLRRQIAGRVKQAYWRAAGTRQIHRLLIENGKNFQQVIDYHVIRVREGAMAEADLLRVRLEGERLAIAANTALLEAERGRIDLLREMGQREFPEVEPADPIDLAVEPQVEIDPARALEQRVEMKLARQAVEQARANSRLQRAIGRPNLDVIFGYKRTLGMDTMLGGIQFDLPFINRNQGNVAAADAEIRFAESTLAAAEALVRAEVRAAQRDYEIRRDRVLRSLPPMRKQAGESSQIALAAYREGGADLLRLLDAERVRLETEVLYYQTLAEFRQSIAAVETAMGVAP